MTFSMPPRKAPRISLFVIRSCWSLVHTLTQLPAVLLSGAVQSFQYANAPFTRRHPRIKVLGTRKERPIHMTICSYRTPNLSLSIAPSCALRPKLQNSKTRKLNSTQVTSSKPGFICISFRFAGSASCCKYAKMLQSADSTFGGPFVS